MPDCQFHPISYQAEDGLLWRGQICDQGGHIVQLSAEYNGRIFPVLENVSLEQVAAKPTSYGCPILFPNAGHNSGPYVWEGHTYNGLPKRHGFVRHRKWQPLPRLNTNKSFHEMCVCIEPDAQENRNHFPYHFSMQTRYQLGEKGLTIQASVQNHGRSFPYSFGLHPYFHHSPTCDVHIPAEKVMSLLEMLPTGSLESVQALPQYDYRGGRRVKDGLDNIFTSLIARQGNQTSGGVSETEEGSEHGISITFDTMRFPFVCGYAPKSRNAICIEPYTSAPDALAHPGEPIWNLQALDKNASVSYEVHIGLNISAWLKSL